MVHDQLNLRLLDPAGAGAAIGANGSSTPILGSNISAGAGYHWIFCEFNLSAVPATPGTATLDVYLQTSCDLGVTWRDIAHAAQFSNAATVTFCQIQGEAIGAAAFLPASDAALAVNTTVQGPWGDRLRVKWVFVLGTSVGTYTLGVNAVLK